jgi:hypothetical protein
LIRKINRFGEVSQSKSEALVTMPFIRLDTKDVELLEENYRQKIKELNYTDSFFYANHFSAIRDRLQMSYDLEGCVDFHHIHKIKLADMLPFLYSMVAIAKEDVNVLWERNNFAIDLTEKKVKALIFEFDGFNLYKKDNKIDGIKELILLALTKNHTILGKPKRADFIEKTDEVIQFSEDILASTSIEEIEDAIHSLETKVQQQLDSKKKDSILSKFKVVKKAPKNKPEPEQPEEPAELQPEQTTQPNKKDKQSLPFKFNKDTLIKIGAVLLSLIVLTVLAYNLSASLDKRADAGGKDEEEILMKALRASSLKEYEDAASYFDEINYQNLSDEDKDVMLLSYLFTDQADKALELEPHFDETVVSYYKATHSMNKIRQLNEIVSSKVIEFELAVYDKDYEKIVELSEDVKLKDNREVDIINAYIQLGDYDGAKKFAEENELDDLLKELQEVKKKG